MCHVLGCHNDGGQTAAETEVMQSYKWDGSFDSISTNALKFSELRRIVHVLSREITFQYNTETCSSAKYNKVMLDGRYS
jgi:hypothetical protein